jgi:hypothetical protein
MDFRPETRAGDWMMQLVWRRNDYTVQPIEHIAEVSGGSASAAELDHRPSTSHLGIDENHTGKKSSLTSQRRRMKAFRDCAAPDECKAWDRH